VLLEPGHAFTGGRLTAQPAGARSWRFDVDGRTRHGLSVGGSEHLTLPPLAPSLCEVGVFLDWFGPATAVAHRLAPLTPWAARVPGARAALPRLAVLVGRQVAAAPSPQDGVRTSVLAEVRDAGGDLVSAVRLTGPEPYAMTADLLAWGAVRAAEGGLPSGAPGPVQAFGLDALTAGAATAGLVRA
jgi:hypothetical protein